MVGKMVRLPITGARNLIVTDDHADPELGSGAVKIRPQPRLAKSANARV
jgi:valyl-tRNA synthetase